MHACWAAWRVRLRCSVRVRRRALSRPALHIDTSLDTDNGLEHPTSAPARMVPGSQSSANSASQSGLAQTLKSQSTLYSDSLVNVLGSQPSAHYAGTDSKKYSL
jgi:hypothetical protein